MNLDLLAEPQRELIVAVQFKGTAGHGERVCHARMGGWGCTRAKDHTGHHIAHLMNGDPCYVWENNGQET